MKNIVIAIDGPAAAGKSTIARKVAEHLHYTYIDTGAMYRALTLHAQQNNVDLTNEEALWQLLKEMDLSLKPSNEVQRVYINGEDVTEKIRTEEVTNAVSTVAAHSRVREIMVEKQRQFAKSGAVVMDGRDIGTAVLPNAELKIFMTASVDERAERRFRENATRGIHTPIETLKNEIATRDEQDMNRRTSPLREAVGAVRIDTTGKPIEQVVRQIIEMAKEFDS